MPSPAITRLTLADVLPTDELAAEIDAAYVTRKHHPELPLSIYTYSRTCQYEQRWNQVTTRCRGIVVDDRTGEIVAHALPKFFDVSMHGTTHPFAPPLPNEPFEVFDKADGSLAICFFFGGRWHAASKGSFISDQAAWATNRLRAADCSRLDPEVTYLAEILYPANRIVVDYGDREDVVLLAAFRADGVELDLDHVADHWSGIGSTVRRLPSSASVADIAAMMLTDTGIDGSTATGEDAEGYVIRFASGLRVKAKYTSYKRLHKLLTGVTPRDIWQYLGVERYGHACTPKKLARALTCSVPEVEGLLAAEGGPLSSLLEHVPDEFDTWVRQVMAEIDRRAGALRARIDSAFEQASRFASDRKAFAAHVEQYRADQTTWGAMFLLLDSRPLDLHVWHAIKPEAATAFKTDEEG